MDAIPENARKYLAGELGRMVERVLEERSNLLPSTAVIGGREYIVVTNGYVALAVLGSDGALKREDGWGTAIAPALKTTHTADAAALLAWCGPGRPETKDCEKCKGTGKIECLECHGRGASRRGCSHCDDEHRCECDVCDGAGEEDCAACIGPPPTALGVLGATGVNRHLVRAALEGRAGPIGVALSSDPYTGIGFAGEGWLAMVMPIRTDEKERANAPTFDGLVPVPAAPTAEARP